MGYFILFLATSLGMWDLISWPGIGPIPLALEVWILNYWTTREFPIGNFRIHKRWWYTKVISWIQFSSVQSFSHVRLFVTPWTATHQASLSITNSWSSLKPMSIESVMPSNHPILCYPLLLLPSIFPQHQGLFQSQFFTSGDQKYWSFNFSISLSNKYSGMISFRMDRLDLLAVQGTLKSLLQHHSSKASILRCSAFFTVQLSHPYMTTGKTIA